MNADEIQWHKRLLMCLMREVKYGASERGVFIHYLISDTCLYPSVRAAENRIIRLYKFCSTLFCNEQLCGGSC